MTADITKTVAPKTDQLNADDLFAGKTMDVKITGVKETGAKEQPISISYEGDNGKPWKPSLGMRRVLIEIWGEQAGKEADKYYRGRIVRLFRDPDVKFGKDTVGGIRISHATDISGDKKIALTVAKGRRVEFVVKPLKNYSPDVNITDKKEDESHVNTNPKPLNPIQKKAKIVVSAINASPNTADLKDLWENGLPSGYKEDIEEIQASSEAAYKFIKGAYDARWSILEAQTVEDVPE